MNQYMKESVSRFLGWKLPADFAPDAGISFKPFANHFMSAEYQYKHEPIGTNLFTANQAKSMLTHVAKPLLDRITELEAQLEATKWQLIETAPDEGTEVIVYTPPMNGEDEQYMLEKYEDECFVAHSNNYEHYCMVAKGGSDCAWIGPSEKPKYTHWIPLTAPPIDAAIQATKEQA